MVKGLGIDLVERERVARILARWGDRLLRHLMDPEEAERLPGTLAARVDALAVAITCKEAASKALGTGWTRGVAWRQVDVDTRGPRLTLRGAAARRARALGSSGATRAVAERRGDLVLARVLLLA